jgi:hypothetical protein
MKLLLENFRKYELLCEIEREIEEYGPLDEGKIDDIVDKLKKAIDDGSIVATQAADLMADAMNIPRREAIALLMFAGIAFSAVGGLAGTSYQKAAGREAAHAEMQAEKEAARIPWKSPSGKVKMPLDLKWQKAPETEGRNLGYKIYVPYDEIPDDYVLPSIGQTKAEFEKSLDRRTPGGLYTWDTKELSNLAYNSMGSWGYVGYSQFQKHPAGPEMLPLAWSIVHHKLLVRQKTL